MKEAIVHIGMHKTGTSSIQESLYGYEDDFISYLNDFESNHSYAITTIFSKRRYNYHWKQKLGLNDREIDILASEYKQKLVKSLSCRGNKKIIISGEDIRHLSEKEKISFVNFLKEFGYDLRILCVFRNPSAYVSSALQTMIRIGLDEVRKIHPQYLSSLSGFEKIIQKDKIQVEDFDYIIKKYKSPVRWFLDQVGIDNKKVKEVKINESISESAIKIIFCLNRLDISTVGDQKHLDARNKLVSSIIKKYPKKKYGNLDKDLCQEALPGKLVEELETINQVYGIQYSINSFSGNTDKLRSYLCDLKDLDLSGIRDLLKENNLQSFTNRGMKDILTALYMKFLLSTSLVDTDADTLRDMALRIEKGDALSLVDALDLMKLARVVRPHGGFICKKVAEYEAKLNKMRT